MASRSSPLMKRSASMPRLTALTWRLCRSSSRPQPVRRTSAFMKSSSLMSDPGTGVCTTPFSSSSRVPRMSCARATRSLSMSSRSWSQASGRAKEQAGMMIGRHLGLHAHRREMLADPGEPVAPVPFGQLAHVVDVEGRAAGDRQADAVCDQRMARGELVEDGNLVGQRGEPLGAIAAEVLPEPLWYDRQELDRIGLGAQEIGQRAVEQQSNAGMTGSRASDPGMPDLGMVELRDACVWPQIRFMVPRSILPGSRCPRARGTRSERRNCTAGSP